MSSMSIRGLDDKALARLKRQAERDGMSLNSLALRLLAGGAQGRARTRGLEQFDDLDALAGTWNAQQSSAFERHVAPFAEVDRALWK